MIGSRQLDRLAQHIEDPLGEKLGSSVQAQRVDQHHELVPTDTADRVVVPQDRLQPRPHLAQYLVSCLTTEAVVDLPEAIDVHEQGRHGDVLPPRSGEDLFGPVEHQASVWHVRQTIVQRVICQLVGLLSNQPPRPLARTREHAVEQKSEDRDQQAGEETLRIDRDRAISRCSHTDQPTFPTRAVQ